MFEVTFTNVNKTVANKIAADALVKQVQAVFGVETAYTISEVSKTYDGNTAAAKEVGTVRKVVEQNPMPVVPKGV